MTRRHAPTLIILALSLALTAAGCGKGGRGPFSRGGGSSGVIARVDGKAISHEQLCQVLEAQDNGQAGKQALETLIVRQLIRDEAQKRGIKVDQKELQSRIDGLKDYILAGTGKDYKAWLVDTGQSEQDIADRVSLQVLTAKLVLTDQDRKQFFEANKAKLKDVPHNNDSVIYRQIVVGTKAEAEAIRNELVKASGGKPVSDEQFAKVAEEKSIDPMTRGRGGMRGWWIKGKGTGMGEKPDAQVETVLFSLKPGELSQALPYARPMPPAQPGQKAPPPQPEQWQIVMVDKDITPAPITLENNQDVIEDWMMSDSRYQYQMQQFFENLRSKAKVEVVAPRYKSVEQEYQQRSEMREKMQQQAPAMGAPPAPGGAAPQLPAGAQPPAGGAARPSGR